MRRTPAQAGRRAFPRRPRCHRLAVACGSARAPCGGAVSRRCGSRRRRGAGGPRSRWRRAAAAAATAGRERAVGRVPGRGRQLELPAGLSGLGRDLALKITVRNAGDGDDPQRSAITIDGSTATISNAARSSDAIAAGLDRRPGAAGRRHGLVGHVGARLRCPPGEDAHLHLAGDRRPRRHPHAAATAPPPASTARPSPGARQTAASSTGSTTVARHRQPRDLRASIRETGDVVEAVRAPTRIVARESSARASPRPGHGREPDITALTRPRRRDRAAIQRRGVVRRTRSTSSSPGARATRRSASARSSRDVPAARGSSIDALAWDSHAPARARRRRRAARRRRRRRARARRRHRAHRVATLGDAARRREGELRR